MVWISIGSRASIGPAKLAKTKKSRERRAEWFIHVIRGRLVFAGAGPRMILR